MHAIEVRGVSKQFRRYGRRRHFATLKSALLSGRPAASVRPEGVFDALTDVSFDVTAGRSFGVIGRNGSGKSTLLKLLAGIGKPTTGSIHVTGRVSALIELGAGFHPEISGRENVYINGMMLGLSRKEIARRFDEIVRFAELEAFIDEPVKTYSSGMYVRLGFAVAIHIDPDVLLVDEVLAVGDEAFTHKCLDTFAELRRRGRTVLLVTHSLDLVRRYCDEALWLDAGTVKAQGDPHRVIDAYLTDVASDETRHLVDAEAARRAEGETTPPTRGEVGPPADMFKAAEGRWGSREVEIVDVDLRGADGQSARVFDTGSRVEVSFGIRCHRPMTDVVFGIGIFNADGVCCYGTNTSIEGGRIDDVASDGRVRFVMGALDLVEGTYKLDVAVHRENGVPYDYHRLLYTFRMKSSVPDTGVYRPRHGWSFDGGIRFVGLGRPEEPR